MAACVLSVIGFALSFWIGIGRFGQSAGDVVWAIVAAQIAAGIALPSTLYFQRTPTLKFLVRGPLRSWVMLLGVSGLVLLGVCPWLRNPEILVWMYLPLCLSIGGVLLVYGPIHDRIISKAAERKR
jgi:hypothetical protein